MGAIADWLVVAVLNVVFAALLTLIFRRLLGPRVGRLRAFVVSLVLLSLFAPIGTAITRAAGFPDAQSLTEHPGAGMLVLAIAFLWTLAAGLAALVILESVAPTGSVPSPLAIARGLRGGLRRVRRYLQLGWVLITSGLSRALRRGPGDTAFDDALVTTMERSGVTFVKLGQILSSRRASSRLRRRPRCRGCRPTRALYRPSRSAHSSPPIGAATSTRWSTTSAPNRSPRARLPKSTRRRCVASRWSSRCSARRPPGRSRSTATS